MTDFQESATPGPNNNRGSNYNNYNNGYPPFQQNDNNIPPRPQNSITLPVIATVVSFITMITCCLGNVIGLVLAIISIVYATQVDSKYNIGDYRGSEQASKSSKQMAKISLGLSILAVIFMLIVLVIYGAALIGAGVLYST